MTSKRLLHSVRKPTQAGSNNIEANLPETQQNYKLRINADHPTGSVTQGPGQHKLPPGPRMSYHGRATHNELPVMKRLLPLLLMMLLALPAWGAVLPINAPVPGGIAIVKVPDNAQQASYDGHRVMLLENKDHTYAIIGLPLDTKPGSHALRVGKAGSASRIPFQVRDKRYREQHLTIKNKSQVNLSAADLARVKRERKAIDAIYDRWTPIRYAALPFSLPVNGPETSEFGVKRFLNGEPRSPHSGIDIAAPAGTPVKAPADGVIAATGDYFFNGNTIIIDHGQGLVSVYVHLSNINVAKGDQVKQGDIIAKVGATGRTTGADLHWTVTLNGNRINPELLLSKEARKALGLQ